MYFLFHFVFFTGASGKVLFIFKIDTDINFLLYKCFKDLVTEAMSSDGCCNNIPSRSYKNIRKENSKI